MQSSSRSRKLLAGAIASLVAHGIALTALAWTVRADLERRMLVVQNIPFAGQQVAVALSFARPEIHVPPPPDAVPMESPVMITPVEAQLDQRVYIDKQAAEVAARATTIVQPVELAANSLPEQPVAERETQTTPAEVAAQSAATVAVAKAAREVMPTTASVTVSPQTIGTNDRKPARMHNNRPPRYPDIARQNRWQGTVLLKLAIDAQGRVTTVAVEKSSGYPVLDAEAAAAVRIWRGEPAILDGVAVDSEEYLPVRFKLQ